jgi:hypothetical protein
MTCRDKAILIVSASLLLLAAGASGCCKHADTKVEDIVKQEPARFVIKSVVSSSRGLSETYIREMVVIEDTQGTNDFLVVIRFSGGITMMPINRIEK